MALTVSILDINNNGKFKQTDKMGWLDASVPVSVHTDVLAKNVFLSNEGSERFFSGNYFDLRPGESKK